MTSQLEKFLRFDGIIDHHDVFSLDDLKITIRKYLDNEDVVPIPIDLIKKYNSCTCVTSLMKLYSSVKDYDGMKKSIVTGKTVQWYLNNQRDEEKIERITGEVDNVMKKFFN